MEVGRWVEKVGGVFVCYFRSVTCVVLCVGGVCVVLGM